MTFLEYWWLVIPAAIAAYVVAVLKNRMTKPKRSGTTPDKKNGKETTRAPSGSGLWRRSIVRLVTSLGLERACYLLNGGWPLILSLVVAAVIPLPYIGWVVIVGGFAGSTYIILSNFDTISARDPVEFGAVTVWGTKTTVPVAEGTRQTANYWPFYIEVYKLKLEWVDLDVVVPDVPCRMEGAGVALAGGFVKVRVQVTLQTDAYDHRDEQGDPVLKGDRVRQFIEVGELEGAKRQLEGIIAEALRQMGETRTWEQMAFAKALLSAILIYRATDLKLPRLKKGPDGKAIRNAAGEVMVDHNAPPVVPESATEEEIAWFIVTALGDGVADSHYMGVSIRRLNVVLVEPQGELKQAAEAAAREVLERRAEERETETVIRLAKMYMKADPTLSFEGAVQKVQVERGKGQQIYIDGNLKGSTPFVNVGGKS